MYLLLIGLSSSEGLSAKCWNEKNIIVLPHPDRELQPQNLNLKNAIVTYGHLIKGFLDVFTQIEKLAYVLRSLSMQYSYWLTQIYNNTSHQVSVELLVIL